MAIGRSIVRDPKVYLFDEPLSNLDAALRVATRIEIAQLQEAMPDSTMIYVTHDQVEAMTLASRIVVLAGGGISQVGTPLELYEMTITKADEYVYSGEVELVEALGEVTQLYFKKEPDGRQIQAKLPGIVTGLRHETVRLAADPARMHLFADGRSLLYR